VSRRSFVSVVKKEEGKKVKKGGGVSGGNEKRRQSSSRRSNGFWSSQENQMKYMEWLGGVLKIDKMDDWYGVTKESFTSNNGGGLLLSYGGSPSEVLISLFPKHDWKPWMFKVAPQGFWSSQENQMKYMEWLGGVLRSMRWMIGTVSLLNHSHRTMEEDCCYCMEDLPVKC